MNYVSTLCLEFIFQSTSGFFSVTAAGYSDTKATVKKWEFYLIYFSWEQANAWLFIYVIYG